MIGKLRKVVNCLFGIDVIILETLKYQVKKCDFNDLKEV